MKKIFVTTLLLISVVTQPSKVSAVECAVCFDPIIMDFVTEAKTALSAGYDIAESIADAAFSAKYLVEITLDIMANTAKHSAVEDIAGSITSWATGAFQGDPTFPTNPERFFQNIDIVGTRLGLDEINEAGGDLLSGNLTDSIVKNFRQDRATIDQKTAVTLGSTIQENICNDANLSAMAKNAVGDVLNGTAYSAKKAELANALCSGNASSDKNTQQVLVNVFKENFSTGGGWDSWLDLTTNKNNTAYGNVMTAKQAVAEKADEKVKLAQDELDQSGGYIGIKTCIKEVFLETEGITSCEEYETQTPGKLISDQLSDGLFGPTKALENAQGYRDIASGLIDGIIGGVVGDFLTKGLSGSANSGTSVNSSNSYTLTSGSYVSTPNNNYSSNVVLTTQEKANAIDQIIKQLDADTSLINFSKNINRQTYFNFISTYEAGLNTLETKYNTLVTEFPLYKAKAMISYGTLYITNQRTEAANFRNQLNTDISNLSKAETIIGTTRSKLNAANSSAEIQAIYKEYTSTVTGKLIPSTVTSAEMIEKVYQNKKAELERDLEQNLNNNLIQCQAAIDLERTKRSCLAQGKYYEWIGYCYYNARRACSDKGGYWAWNGTSCIDTTPTVDSSWVIQNSG